MSTLNPTRKVSRRHALREDRVITFYARVLNLIENYRTAVYAALGGIVLVVALVIGYSYLQANKNEQAVSAMAKAVAKYEAGDYQAALDGDASFEGLLGVADDFGGTRAGNLAKFYAADAFFRLGKFDEALKYFKDFDKGANYLGASAYAGEAAIYAARNDPEKAGEYYMRAADIFPNTVTTPEYLLNAGLSYEDAREWDAAEQAYKRLQSKYPESPLARNVEFFLARIAAARTK